MQDMSYTDIIQKFGLKYGDEFSNLPEDYNFYGIYNGRFEWYSKDDFRQFVLHHLIDYCFQQVDIEHIETLEEGLEKHFKTPQNADRILSEFRSIADSVLSADHRFEDISDFLNQFFFEEADMFGPTRGIFWIGKLKDLTSEDGSFASDLRMKFKFSSDPLMEEDIPDFVDFLEHMGYLNEHRKSLDYAIENKGEIDALRGEPDYYFPTEKEIIAELKEFAEEFKDKENIMKVIREEFPELRLYLPE